VPDRRGTDPTRTMAVQYVKFSLSPAALAAVRARSGPVLLGVAHPAYAAEVELGPRTLASLGDDLA